jgi:tetratricopeptide (TPR) repeat protein
MKAIEKKPEDRYQNANELIEDLKKVLPTLQTDGYRQLRATDSLLKPRTYSASALTTIADTLRQPGPSLGKLIIGALLIVVAIVGLVIWWRPAPYKPTTEAKAFYDKGLDALRNGAFLQATKAFEQALAKDPKFPLAHARLAEAWNELDYSDNAKDEMLNVQTLVPNRSQLARTDALYLEGINATVARDYQVGIKAYSELVRLNPNDAGAYLDLGRAYEKNDQILEAIKNYVEAATRAPQQATAFLRAGILYSRQGNQAAAAAAFDKAETLYQADGNFEGQGEVSFQRGFIFDKLSKLPEAREHLGRALELARTTSNDYLYVKSLLKMADIKEEEGNIDGARKDINEAIQRAQTKDIGNLTKQGIIDLGYTYVVAGDYPEAEKYFKQSLDLAQKQNDERNSARALLTLASLAERRNDPDAALNYLNQAIPFYQKGGYRRETGQAFSLLARGKVHKGEYAEALDGYQQGLKVAQESGDATLTLTAHDDIGRLFIRQGRYPEAIEHLDESLKIAKSVGNPKNVALAATDLANAFWRLGRYDNAQTAVHEAADFIAKPTAPPNISSIYYLVLARVALSQSHWPDAQTNGQKAYDRAGTDLPGIAAEASLTLCLTQTLSGGRKKGQSNCEHAVETARQANDPAVLGESLLALATAMAQAGDPAGASNNALEAQQIFARAGRHDCEWLAWLVAARASKASGDNEKARDYASRAQQVLSSIEQQWGNDYYNTYLNRPDVQLSRKQLEEIVSGKT